MVPIASSLGGGTNGYLSLPSSAGRHPAVIVIHEWWGLTDWIRESTDHFAGEGYVALAVDLYHGKSTSDPNEAHELMRGLPEDRAAADLKGAFDTLAKRSDVDPARIGVVGWCMGGGYSLGLALGEPRLAATVMNYGRLVLDPKAIAAIRSPDSRKFWRTGSGDPGRRGQKVRRGSDGRSDFERHQDLS